ncbi:WG repeat-containing protein [Helcococcus kunzii]|uniref:WG repeat-containing protein n=1 Tax=Helcococcus kunzii TaxID=40091 RepID=UPI0024ACD953|nr:WG repeat-containing protein [Helcococcus kunzii]
MNNYKKLVPAGLIIMFALSVFYFFNEKANLEKKYINTVAEARELRKEKVDVDSINSYHEALDMKKTPEIYIELAEYYKELEKKDEAISIGENLNRDFPKEVKGYEFLVNLYAKEKDYTNMFATYEEFKSRKLSSKAIEEIYTKNEYVYQINELMNEVKVPSNGLVAFREGDKWGYMDKSLKATITSKYKYTDLFRNNRAYVTTASDEHYYIDKKGEKRHDLMNIEGIEKAGVISVKGFTAKTKEGWNIYDLSNNKMAGPFDEVSNVENSLIVATKDGKTKIYNLDNKKAYDIEGEIINNEYNMPIENDRIFSKVGDKVNLYDSEGKLIAEGFEDAKPFITNGAAVKKNGKWGFINFDGEVVIEYQYEDAKSLSNSHAAVKKGGKWGYINTKNEMVIPAQFEEASNMTNDGILIVKLDGRWNLISLYKYSGNEE